ncbi:sensor histidine kinase [Algihabitans albus]|uniref:sensor histidine kinase n=1 Tax=Algihabitans albus TaxID=2164067 RepID=UPI000E5D57CA|nr:sensor histidine kinase [Algihabitans albus]
MLPAGVVILVSGLYLGLLFLLAFVTERRVRSGSARFIASPLVYTLSLAVYCTSWTFYGAVGSASRNGLEFLTIYLGPTIVFVGWWLLLRKLVRISRTQNITSIADFISARYGKSAAISALVTLMAVIGSIPYISLQLKAITASYEVLVGTSATGGAGSSAGIVTDTGFWVTASMAAFVILFGTRNLGADQRHPGVVAAIAFESVIKLLSFAAVGLFALYGLSDGFGDLFSRVRETPELSHLYSFPDGFEPRWVATLFLAGIAAICLPRQFQVTVVENSDERHLATASWLFPLYLMLISLFVLPIAAVGLTALPAGANTDLYVLTVPLSAGREDLALLAFIGGLSAATSMVIVASLALSIMISNHLVAPLLLRSPYFTSPEAGNFSGTLLLTRRLSIVAILVLGFLYYRGTDTGSPLASIGLISFAGVAQFAPALIGGVYWKQATKAGALCGLVAGFVFWAYTLLAPTLAEAGWALEELVTQGLGGVALLRPDALFGLEGWDPLVHGLFWSMSANVAAFVVVSLVTRPTPIESLQSALFVNALQLGETRAEVALQRSATVKDLFRLAQRILGAERSYQIFRDYARRQGREDHLPAPDPPLVAYVERQLASSVGAASARSLVSGIAKGETISLDALIGILDETQQAIRTSRALERKSRELQETATQLRAANAQLKALDKMKDDFLSRVSHELRTPMTSIRSFAEILSDMHNQGPSLDSEQAGRFLKIIHLESERLTRLLDEILDLSRMESGEATLRQDRLDAAAIARIAVETMEGLAKQSGVELEIDLGSQPIWVIGDGDRLKQVFVNLLSNAIKYHRPEEASPETAPKDEALEGKGQENSRSTRKAWITQGTSQDGLVELQVCDNGPGIPEGHRDKIFSKFARAWNEDGGEPRSGSGLGLPISRQIVEHLGGQLRLDNTGPEGSVFVVRLRRTATIAAQ